MMKSWRKYRAEHYCFGTTMGATLGLGLWLNRHQIATTQVPPPISISRVVEWLLIALHIFLLLCSEFGLVRQLGWIYGPGLFLAFIPIVAITGGRAWPYWLVFPITMIPFAGKTLRNLVYENHVLSPNHGWTYCVAIPIALTMLAAWYFARRPFQYRPARSFLRTGLFLMTWLAFSLNFAFFRFPWPWSPWTPRTPNAIVYTVCALYLTILVVYSTGNRSSTADTPPDDQY